MIRISKEEARAYLVRYHMLERRQPKSALPRIFSRLRTIQYDPLQVVGRNADLVLKARLKNFHPSDLARALYEERWLIDGWDKMMNIYPVADREQMTPLSELLAEEIAAKGRELNSVDFAAVVDLVRERLADGALIRNSELTKELGMGKQGSYSPVQILDYLFYRGEAAIAHKENTQKIFQYAKRPKIHQADEAFLDWYALRRVESTGLIRSGPSDAWLGYYLWYKEHREPAIRRLLDKGLIREVEITGVKGTYLMPEAADQLNDLNLPRPECRLLAPLDNMLWDRKLLREVFDFDYKWEVYVPEAKRQWGYYVLPILYGDRLIGRLEPERSTGGPIEVKSLWWEPGVRPPLKALEKELATFTDYLKPPEREKIKLSK